MASQMRSADPILIGVSLSNRWKNSLVRALDILRKNNHDPQASDEDLLELLLINGIFHVIQREESRS